jgi:hypothetical protein
MAGSITYPAVTGTRSNGSAVTIAVGDLVTGRDGQGRLISGRVIATHPHYPSLTVRGVGIGDDGVSEADAVVYVSTVLTHERRPTVVGQSRKW